MRLVIAATLGLALNGCAWSPSAVQYVASQADEDGCSIPLYRSRRPSTPFQELGIIEAYGGGIRGAGDLSNLQRSLSLIRKKGCEVGADALIDVQATTDGGLFIATAVRYTEAGPGGVR